MRVSQPEEGRLNRYGLALACVISAFTLVFATWPILKPTSWAPFIIAVMISSWFGGYGPGFLAVATSAILGQYFLFEPYGSFRPGDNSGFRSFVFVVLSSFVTFLVSSKRRAEHVERAERRRFQATVASIGDAVIATDNRGRVTFMNGVAEKLTAWPESEARMSSVEEIFVIVNETTRATLANPVQKVLESGQIQGLSNHTILIARDGTERPIDDSAAPIKDDSGHLLGVVLVFRDITERKKSEVELRGSRERLSLALQAGRMGAWELDIASGLLTCTDQCKANYGRAPGECFSYEELAESVHEQDSAMWRKAVGDAIAAASELHVEYRTRWPDGSVHWVNVLANCSTDKGGKVVAMSGVSFETTERKQAEEATQRRATQMQKLAEIATRVHSARDVNSVIGVVTEEARHLIGAHQSATSMVLNPDYPQPINVTSVSEKYPRDSTSPVIDSLAFFELVQVANGPVLLTHEQLDADPRWRRMAKLVALAPAANGWLAVPIVGRDGKSMGIIQIADKKEGELTGDDQALIVQLSRLAAIAIQNARLNEELRTNDERKDEFLAMLAHELRNPLAAIGNAVKLVEKSDSQENIDWSLEVIGRQMLHLSRLIDDLMDVSRITRGKIQLRRDVMDVTPVLESAATTVGTLVEERKHTLELDIEPGGLWINADPTRLEQVVVNLLNNAAKYSENGGHILLSATKEEDQVVVRVRDRGVGIAPEKLPEMFELFAQGDRSLARSEGGLGIGLTVVRKLVEMHGGSVAATSEGPGMGSEFTIRLPLAIKPAIASKFDSPATEIPRRKVSILVVDDNVDTVRGMARLLKVIGHDVATAHDGLEALGIAREFRPEFILLDIGLPGMSGYEVATQLRREECCRDATIVAVSGYSQDTDRRQSKAAGFDYHLTKPLDHDALLTLLSAGSNGQG